MSTSITHRKLNRLTLLRSAAGVGLALPVIRQRVPAAAKALDASPMTIKTYLIVIPRAAARATTRRASSINCSCRRGTRKEWSISSNSRWLA